MIKEFIQIHWEWLTGVLVSLIGVVISFKAYKYSKRANKDTNELLKRILGISIKSNNREEIHNNLISAGLSEWRINGQAKTFLLQEFEHLKDKDWSKKEFEEIYETIAMRHKGRKPKRSLFDKD